MVTGAPHRPLFPQKGRLPTTSQGMAIPLQLLLLAQGRQRNNVSFPCRMNISKKINEKISKINKTEQPAAARLALTSGGAGDAAAALTEAGAVHHHPALVGLLPGLSHHVGCPSCVVVASLGCEGKVDQSPPRAFPHGDTSGNTGRKGPHALTALREKEGAATYPQVCRSTRPSRCPGTHTPACTRLFRGAGAMYRQSCRTGRPHGSDLWCERGELR